MHGNYDAFSIDLGGRELGQRSGFLHSTCLGALSLDDEIGLTAFGIVGMRLDTLGAPNTSVTSK